ncbi:MAG: two-component regulator propeller domain-containing protein [Calditrichaceae bacterium]
MWFGTQDGLNRYDGYQFKVFKNDPSDKTSLTENFIFSIYENPSGTLFFETQNGIMHQYYPKSESFRVVKKDSVILQNARISTVGALLQESSGVIWTGGLSRGTGLKRTDTKTGQVTVFKNEPDNPASLSDNRVYSIFRDHSGNLWIGTYNGLDQLDETSDKFSHYRNDPDNPNSLPDNWVWPIFEDSRSHLWIGTVRAGLSQFDQNTKTFINYKNDQNNPASLSSNFIFSIFQDKAGLIWIGTNMGGIDFSNPSANTFEHYQTEKGNKNSLNDNAVNSILVDKKGNYWIGTNEGGLNKFDYKNKRFTSYKHDPKNPNSLTSNAIQSLMVDRSGIIWIGTFSNGLNAFNPITGSFKHYLHDASNPFSVSDDRIYAMVEDKKGYIWIGTYAGGLNKFDRSTGRFFNFRHNADDSTSISSDATWSVGLDASDNPWVGTFGGGLNIYNEQKKTFRHYKNDPDDSTSIIDDNIIRVFKDSKNNMWLGSTKGLSRYQPASDNFKNYTEKDGLSNSYVYGIVEDNKGSLWLSTNYGLSKFNPESETFKDYYYKDGLQGNEFNHNAYAKDERTGNILFGGPNGLNIFNPMDFKENSYVPPVEFTGYVRYNTDDEEGRPIVEKGIAFRDTIFLTHKDNIITLEFAALSYYNNLENQYRYKLEGFNDNWIQLGNNHSVTFTNLSPGEYRLTVLGSNNDGLWNEKGASLMIIVSPPWWRTNFAIILYFFAVFSILFGLRRYEINRREQKAQIRESALRIKATEAEKRALEIENDRKTKELEQARQLQLSMLPKELPELPDLEIAAFMRTATEVGGDYYDFIVEDNGTLNVAFGDATGHGLQAGTMVTLMKGFFTSDSSRLGLRKFMEHCNRFIKEIKLGRILMSFSYLKIENRKLQMTSGGMPPVYFYNQGTNQVEEILVQGMPLGAMRNAKYEVIEKELKSGDTLLLLTDGLPEIMNSQSEMFDYSQVKNHFNTLIENSPKCIIEKLVEAGDSWMNGGVQEDDISFVVIRLK